MVALQAASTEGNGQMPAEIASDPIQLERQLGDDAERPSPRTPISASNHSRIPTCARAATSHHSPLASAFSSSISSWCVRPVVPRRASPPCRERGFGAGSMGKNCPGRDSLLSLPRAHPGSMTQCSDPRRGRRALIHFAKVIVRRLAALEVAFERVRSRRHDRTPCHARAHDVLHVALFCGKTTASAACSESRYICRAVSTSC